MTRQEREELKALSTEVFGKSSYYKKLIEVSKILTKTATETVKNEDGTEETKEVQVPVMMGSAKVMSSQTRTTEEVRDILLEYKAKRDEVLKKIQDEKQAKMIQESVAGSAV